MIELPSPPIYLEYVTIHATFTSPSMDIGAKEVHRWHLEKGRDSIGYNAVIRRDGTVEPGRPPHITAAHALGRNSDGYGIALVGGKMQDTKSWDFNFTFDQICSLIELVKAIKLNYPEIEVEGHRDADSRRDCPGFDVKALFANFE